MKKILIAIVVCGSMGAAGGWFVSGEIKKEWPVPIPIPLPLPFPSIEGKKSKVYEVKGQWKDDTLELTR